jgi:hypothetical protein
MVGTPMRRFLAALLMSLLTSRLRAERFEGP